MSLSKEDLVDIRTLIVDGTMEALNAVVIPRLDEHDKQFETIDKHFDRIEARLDRLSDVFSVAGNPANGMKEGIEGDMRT